MWRDVFRRETVDGSGGIGASCNEKRRRINWKHDSRFRRVCRPSNSFACASQAFSGGRWTTRRRDDATTQRRDAVPAASVATTRDIRSFARFTRSPALACLLSVVDTLRIVPRNGFENLKRKLTIRRMRKSCSESYGIPGFSSKLSQVRPLSTSIPT